MLTTPFLTQLDSRAEIKGSRDPLGFQSLWTRLGRHVVANLTTVSTSVRDFTVLLMGLAIAERVSDAGGTEGELATFLKWEQLTGYARAETGEKKFRGTERVHARLAKERRVSLGVDAASQILGNQKIYGLWGIYLQPAKASGLVEAETPRLTAEGRKVAEISLSVLESECVGGIARVLKLLRPERGTLDVDREESLLTGIMQAVKTGPTQRKLYRYHLRDGGPADLDPEHGTQGKQRLLATLLEENHAHAAAPWSPRLLEALARGAAQRGGEGEQLAIRLRRIRTAELLLAPASTFFEHLLGCDGQKVEGVERAVRGHWGNRLRNTLDVEGLEALEPELRFKGDDGSVRRLIDLGHALAQAEYARAIELVVEQNASVMKVRSAAAPWIELRQGTLHVRFRDEQVPELPARDELPSYWVHSYFLQSLWAITAALKGAA
jgi:hypothetical protein